MDLDLDARWGIAGKIHGGYLLRALAAAAVSDEHPHPLAVSAHFLRAPDPGPAHVKADRLRSGRRVDQSRVTLVQGEVCAEALVTTGLLSEQAEPFWTDSTPPDLPPIGECLHMPTEPSPGFRVGHLDFVEVRCDPATVGFASGLPGQAGRSAGWAAMREVSQRDGSLPDASARVSVLDLLVIADALPPVTFDLGVPGWVPTLELTVYVRAVPAPGPVRVQQDARLLEDGWLDENCDIWDSRGRLVAQARQLAGYRTR